MPSMSEVELYAAIRRDSRAGVSGRAIERKYNVGWRTAQQALTSTWPTERKGHRRGPRSWIHSIRRSTRCCGTTFGHRASSGTR